MFHLRAFRMSDGRTAYMFSVVGGPQDLIARLTEAGAMRDGIEYVRSHYPQFAPPQPQNGDLAVLPVK